jgi:hypothetical protein
MKMPLFRFALAAGLALSACHKSEAPVAAPVAHAESHGQTATLTARLVPALVEQTAAGGAVTASLEIDAEPGFHTGRFVVGVYRSDGSVVDTQRSGNFAITDGAAAHTIVWPVLTDGFYVARATAVATSGAEDGSAVHELFLEVHDGDVEVLEINDWSIRSGAIDARPAL